MRTPLEALEERSLLTTYTVTSTADSGAGSLRAAVNSANTNPGPDTIQFSSTTFPAGSLTTITLTTTGMEITDDLTINGPGQNVLTISGNNSGRIFRVDTGVTVTLDSMTLANGKASSSIVFGSLGGAIYDAGDLTISNSTLSNNNVIGGTGADGTTAGGNGTGGGTAVGGAIAVTASASLNLIHSTVTGNSATGGNGGNGASGTGATLGQGGDGGVGGNAYGGAIGDFGSQNITITLSSFSSNNAIGGFGGNGGAGANGVDQAFGTSGGSGGAGGAGGAGGQARGGALFTAGSSNLISQTTVSGNSVVGGSGGLSGAGGNGGGSGTNGNGGLGGLGEFNGGAGGSALGGGLYVSNTSTATVDTSTFSVNFAAGGTGGNGNKGGSGGNFDPGTQGGPGGASNGSRGGAGGNANGAGIANAGTLTVQQSTVTGNSATSGSGGTGGNGGNGGNGYLGGAIGGNGGFGGNTGQANGGGIYNNYILDLYQSTLTDNTTNSNTSPGNAGIHGLGGANHLGVQTATNGSNGLPGTHGLDDGAGLWADDRQLVTNTIVSGNTGTLAGFSNINGILDSNSSFNLITDNSSGLTNGVNGNIVGASVNSMLKNLLDNGGHTQTQELLAGSPAIDAGSNALIPGHASVDQNGNPRIINGAVDIGATEFFPSTITTATALILPPQSAPSGTTLTLTATVTAPGTELSGNVVFLDGGKSIATASLTPGLSSATATFTTNSLSIGQHTITAVYVGEGTVLQTSNSAAQVLLVGTNHQRYVAQLYRDLLSREADAGGLANWTALLDNGTTYGTVAFDITSSREYDGIIVDAFYVQYLNRHAETGGLNGWVDKMQGGLNAEVIRAGILGSQEYYDLTGPGGHNGTDNTFITALYQQFLNRTPDNFGLGQWLAILGGDPNNRQTVASGISNSDENRTDIVTAFYQTYLHRAPDAGGLAHWKDLLANGISQPNIISQFVTSPEYFTRYQIV